MGSIKELTDHEIDEVSGGFLKFIVKVVALVASYVISNGKSVGINVKIPFGGGCKYPSEELGSAGKKNPGGTSGTCFLK